MRCEHILYTSLNIHNQQAVHMKHHALFQRHHGTQGQGHQVNNTDVTCKCLAEGTHFSYDVPNNLSQVGRTDFVKVRYRHMNDRKNQQMHRQTKNSLSPLVLSGRMGQKEWGWGGGEGCINMMQLLFYSDSFQNNCSFGVCLIVTNYF